MFVGADLIQDISEVEGEAPGDRRKVAMKGASWGAGVRDFAAYVGAGISKWSLPAVVRGAFLRQATNADAAKKGAQEGRLRTTEALMTHQSFLVPVAFMFHQLHGYSMSQIPSRVTLKASLRSTCAVCESSSCEWCAEVASVEMTWPYQKARRERYCD